MLLLLLFCCCDSFSQHSSADPHKPAALFRDPHAHQAQNLLPPVVVRCAMCDFSLCPCLAFCWRPLIVIDC